MSDLKEIISKFKDWIDNNDHTHRKDLIHIMEDIESLSKEEIERAYHMAVYLKDIENIPDYVWKFLNENIKTDFL
jgi:Na+/phosphate symporter